jgi:hypothetical protein
MNKNKGEGEEGHKGQAKRCRREKKSIIKASDTSDLDFFSFSSFVLSLYA